jgi:hypothetical protein
MHIVTSAGTRLESQLVAPNLHAPLVEDFIDAIAKAASRQSPVKREGR